MRLGQQRTPVGKIVKNQRGHDEIHTRVVRHGQGFLEVGRLDRCPAREALPSGGHHLLGLVHCQDGCAAIHQLLGQVAAGTAQLQNLLPCQGPQELQNGGSVVEGIRSASR